MRTWAWLALAFGHSVVSKARVVVKTEAEFGEMHGIEQAEVEGAVRRAALVNPDIEAGRCVRTYPPSHLGGRTVAHGDDWDGGKPAACLNPGEGTHMDLGSTMRCIAEQHRMQDAGRGGFVAAAQDVSNGATELGAFGRPRTSGVELGRADTTALQGGFAQGCWSDEHRNKVKDKKWYKIGVNEEPGTDVTDACIGTGADNLFVSYGQTVRKSSDGAQIMSWLWDDEQGMIRMYYSKEFAYGLFSKQTNKGTKGQTLDNLPGLGVKAACYMKPDKCPDLVYCFTCSGMGCPKKRNCPGAQGAWSPAQAAAAVSKQVPAWKPCVFNKEEDGLGWKACDPASHVTLAGGNAFVLRALVSAGSEPRYRLQMAIEDASFQPCFLHSLLTCNEKNVQGMGRMYADPEQFGPSDPMQVCFHDAYSLEG